MNEAGSDGEREQPESGDRHGESHLRVTHILGVTAACALVLAIRIASAGEIAAEYALYFHISNGIAALFHGTAIAGFFLLVWRWRIGRVVSLNRSGHWLLCLFASCLAIQYVVTILVRVYRSYSPGAYVDYFSWHGSYFASTLGASICSLLFARRIRGRWWKAALVVSGVALLVLALISLLAMSAWSPWYWRGQLVLQVCLGVGILAFGALGCRADLRDQSPADWLHWLGVGMFLVGAVSEIANGLYSLRYLA